MGISVIGQDQGDQAPHRRCEPEGARPEVITVVVVLIILVALVLSLIVQFLGSAWLAQKLDEVRWFWQEVNVLWPR
jgi:hypothetical protein